VQLFTDASGINISLGTNPVPEPGTLFLATTGTLGLVGYRRWGMAKSQPKDNRSHANSTPLAQRG
jgi:hypothetical protein